MGKRQSGAEGGERLNRHSPPRLVSSLIDGAFGFLHVMHSVCWQLCAPSRVSHICRQDQARKELCERPCCQHTSASRWVPHAALLVDGVPDPITCKVANVDVQLLEGMRLVLAGSNASCANLPTFAD